MAPVRSCTARSYNGAREFAFRCASKLCMQDGRKGFHGEKGPACPGGRDRHVLRQSTPSARNSTPGRQGRRACARRRSCGALTCP
eukprot:353842-Chlamydomonas_euryale.AAC.10